MGLLPYYLGHTLVNCIRKLFRTWVAIFLLFILFCGLMGGVIGLGIGAVIAGTEEDDPGYTEEDPEWEDDEPLEIELDDGTVIRMDDMEHWPEEVWEVVLSLVGGILFVLITALTLGTIYGGDKSGSAIFTMPDVNLLFPSPQQPQSVLQFRMVMGMGTVLVGSLYLLFQIPNLVLNLHLGWGAVLALLGGWAVLVLVWQVLKVFTYVLVSHCVGWRVTPNRALVAVIGAASLLWYGLTARSLDGDWLGAVMQTFGSPWVLKIPFVGWLTGFILNGFRGAWGAAAGYMAATVVGIVLLTVITQRIPTDFYEDALPGAEKNQTLAEVRAGKKQGLQREPKKRSAKAHARMERANGIGFGQGGQMFLVRNLYHRGRSAFLGLFTGTCIGYTLLCVGYSLLLKFAFKSDMTAPLFGILIYIIFFRTMGNPLAAELELNYLYLVPDSAFAKLAFGLSSGTLDCLLDLLPGLAVVVILLAPPLGETLLWLLLMVAVDFLISATGLAANLLLPTGLAAAVYGMIQIMVMFLAIVPCIIPLIAGLILGHAAAGIAGSAGICVLLGVILTAISCGALEKGKN